MLLVCKTTNKQKHPGYGYRAFVNKWACVIINLPFLPKKYVAMYYKLNSRISFDIFVRGGGSDKLVLMLFILAVVLVVV